MTNDAFWLYSGSHNEHFCFIPAAGAVDGCKSLSVSDARSCGEMMHLFEHQPDWPANITRPRGQKPFIIQLLYDHNHVLIDILNDSNCEFSPENSLERYKQAFVQVFHIIAFSCILQLSLTHCIQMLTFLNVHFLLAIFPLFSFLIKFYIIFVET